MNKNEFKKFMENWAEEIKNSSPEQIQQLRKDLDSMPSNEYYSLPEGLELDIPDDLDTIYSNTASQKYTINVNANYDYYTDTSFNDSRANSYRPQNLSSTNKVRQALNYKPAA